MAGHAPALYTPHILLSFCCSAIEAKSLLLLILGMPIMSHKHLSHGMSQVSDVPLASTAAAKRFCHCRLSRDPAGSRSVVHSKTRPDVQAQQALHQPQSMLTPARAQVLLATLCSDGSNVCTFAGHIKIESPGVSAH